MKMTAIVQRATKRDYVDLHAIFTSGRVELADTVSAMKTKFPGVDPYLALRGRVAPAVARRGAHRSGRAHSRIRALRKSGSLRAVPVDDARRGDGSG